MREAVVETRGAGDLREPDDVVAAWRRVWERGVAEAEVSDDARLVARRRDYGSYPIAVVDLILAIVTVVVLSLPLSLLATYLYLHAGHSLGTQAGQKAFQAWLNSPPPEFTLPALLVTDAGILLVLWYRLSRLRLSWSLFGWGFALRRKPGQAVLIGIGVGVVALILSSIATYVFKRLGADVQGQDRQLIEPLRHAPAWAVIGFVLAATFVAPIVEETLFRGYLFRALAARHGVAPAYMFSGGSFALYHLLSGGALLPLIPALFIVGLLLCFAYHRTGNLLADITAHVLNNGVAFFLSLVLRQ